MYPPLAVKNFYDGIEFQIPMRWYEVRILLRLIHLLLVVLCSTKFIPDDLLYTHPRLRIARRILVTPVGLFYVLAERKFYPLRGTAEFHFIGKHAPSQFYNLILTSNRIRRAVQEVCDRQATCQFPVHSNVIAVDNVADSHLRGNCLPCFIHTFRDRGV